MTHPQESSDSQPNHPGLIVRVGQLFMSPAALFDSIKERPVWFVALVVQLVLGGALVIAYSSVVPESARVAIAENAILALAPDADVARLQEMAQAQATASPVVQIVTMAFFTPVVHLIMASILLLNYKVVLGGSGTFKQLFSTSVHAVGFLSLAGGIVTLVFHMLGSTEPALNLGLLLSGSIGGLLGRVISGIGIFGIWACIALGIAVSRIFPQRSPRAAAGFVFAIYLFAIALVTVLQGLGMSMAAS